MVTAPLAAPPTEAELSKARFLNWPYIPVLYSVCYIPESTYGSLFHALFYSTSEICNMGCMWLVTCAIFKLRNFIRKQIRKQVENTIKVGSGFEN